MNCSVFILALIVSFTVLGNVTSRRKKSSPPKWKSNSMPAQDMRIKSVMEENDVKFDCKAQGHPKPSIRWTRNGQPLRKNMPKVVIKKFGLSLENVTTAMSGNYTCVVENDLGSIDWTFMLDVQASAWPLVVEGPDNVTALVGAEVAFQCRVLNDPKASINWERVYKIKGSKKPKTEFINRDPSANPEVLRIPNVQKEHEGEYQCMAGNIMGLKYSSAWLTVIEPVVTSPPTPPRGIGYDMDNDNNGYLNNNNMNTYNVNGLDRFGQPYDPQNPNIFNNMNSFYTTRRPRKNKGRGKNGRKKNKKNKNKDKHVPKTRPPPPPTTASITELPTESSTPYYFWTESTTPTTYNNFYNNWDRSTFATNDVWAGDDDENLGLPDNHYDPQRTTPKPGETGRAKDEEKKGGDDISEWKIYTIVGAVGGVILLIGLIAITIALCCPKREGAVYKATPV